jgi:AAA+ ATPase superfamily predicted ATPase
LKRGTEKVCREFLIEKRDTLPCQFQKIGGQWGAIPKHEKGRNQYEIDIVTLNEERKEIGFFECKYKTLKFKDAWDILAELKKKSRYVDWNTGKRKEYFGLIAKKVDEKEKLREKGYIVFDFDDF